MKKKTEKPYQEPDDPRVQKKRMFGKQFVLTYVGMMLLSGVQVGIIISPPFQALHEIPQVIVILVYWALMAVLFGLVTNGQIQRAYDMPMRKLGAAAKKVAEGDFSVYLEPAHISTQHDYIDVMFLDFNTMVHDLGSIETLKNDFIANVSHEMKTPIAIMQNYADVLKKKDISYEQRVEYCDTIITAAQSLTDLITNILKLNKLDNQEITPVMEPYDVCGQLVECVLRIESSLEKKGIEIEADMEDRAMIRADASMMEIVWNNILSNALKFTPAGGTISLIQASDTDTVTVTISDTGCGMDEEVLKHIFDKFYQGDTSHATQGNGLGMALVWRVIERVNGEIKVESTPGEGTTFTVVLRAA